jgi:hypothetical protein
MGIKTEEVDKPQIRPTIKSLVHKFEANKYHYLSKKYLEENVRAE